VRPRPSGAQPGLCGVAGVSGFGAGYATPTWALPGSAFAVLEALTTNRRPDQMSSMAQTLLSRRPRPSSTEVCAIDDIWSGLDLWSGSKDRKSRPEQRPRRGRVSRAEPGSTPATPTGRSWPRRGAPHTTRHHPRLNPIHQQQSATPGASRHAGRAAPGPASARARSHALDRQPGPHNRHHVVADLVWHALRPRFQRQCSDRDRACTPRSIIADCITDTTTSPHRPRPAHPSHLAEETPKSTM